MNFVTPFSQSLCPFCFKYFHPGDCHVLTKIKRDEPDILLGAHLNITPPRRRPVTEPSGDWKARLLRKFVIPYVRDGDKVCPHCHIMLPFQFVQGGMSMRSIAFIGVRSSGKSNYIGTLIHSLLNRYQSEVGFDLRSEMSFDIKDSTTMTNSSELYRRRYENMLFSKKLAIPPTYSAVQDREVQVPLIYRLVPEHNPRKNVLLSLFDAAGEDFRNPEVMRRLYPYLATASGIVFLLDPFGFEGFVNSLPSAERQQVKRPQDDPMDIVDAVMTQFEEARNAKGSMKLKVPVAFVVSKSDEIDQVVENPAKAPFLQEIHHEKGFNEHASKSASDALETMFTQWMTGHLRHGLKRKTIPNSRFFAVSALGQRPVPVTVPGETDPQLQLHKPIVSRNLADPFLWMLYEFGCLPESPASKEARDREEEIIQIKNLKKRRLA